MINMNWRSFLMSCSLKPPIIIEALKNDLMIYPMNLVRFKYLELKTSFHMYYFSPRPNWNMLHWILCKWGNPWSFSLYLSLSHCSPPSHQTVASCKQKASKYVLCVILRNWGIHSIMHILPLAWFQPQFLLGIQTQYTQKISSKIYLFSGDKLDM